MYHEFFLHFGTKLRWALLLTSKDTNNHKINERADGQENLGELPLDVAWVSVHPSSVMWWRVKPPHLNSFHLQNAVYPPCEGWDACSIHHLLKAFCKVALEQGSEQQYWIGSLRDFDHTGDSTTTWPGAKPLPTTAHCDKGAPCVIICFSHKG